MMSLNNKTQVKTMNYLLLEHIKNIFCGLKFCMQRNGLSLIFSVLLMACSSTAYENHNDGEEIKSFNLKPDLICKSPHLYANKVVGDGHCVSLIKRCSYSADNPKWINGNTDEWRPSKFVLNLKEQLPLGTIIATFENNRYPNRTGHHAAIYISHDASGIWVWDQWQGKAVHRRLIRTRTDKASAGNTAQQYRVVSLGD